MPIVHLKQCRWVLDYLFILKILNENLFDPDILETVNIMVIKSYSM